MDIQQKDKESLAVYIKRFKREAKRCNFTNNVATIRIIMKGLKNAHTLATHAYEKGLQNSGRCHHRGTETAGSTTIDSHSVTLFYVQCNVQ